MVHIESRLTLLYRSFWRALTFLYDVLRVVSGTFVEIVLSFSVFIVAIQEL